MKPPVYYNISKKEAAAAAEKLKNHYDLNLITFKLKQSTWNFMNNIHGIALNHGIPIKDTFVRTGLNNTIILNTIRYCKVEQ